LSKIRVYQVAKELNVTSKEIINKLEDLKIEVNNHMSTLEDNEVAIVKKIFNKGDEKVAKKESPKQEVKEKKPSETKESSAKKDDNKKPEAKTEDNQKPKKKTSWTVGTPKVNRPKRKSDYQNKNKRNDYRNKNSQPPRNSKFVEALKKVEPVKEQPKKPTPKPAPKPVEKKVEQQVAKTAPVTSKPVEKAAPKGQTTNRPSTNKPANRDNKRPDNKKPYNNNNNQKKNDSRDNNKSNFKSNDKPNFSKPAPAPAPAATAGKDTRKHNNKKKKKHEPKKFDKNASLEERFSKKVKGKKKRKIEKTVDTSRYYDADGNLMIHETVKVGEFSEMLGKTSAEIIMKLMGMGIMANVNQDIEFETAELIAMEFDVPSKMIVPVDETEEIIESYFEEDEDEKDLVGRPPVVTVMGHVDHGKTSLLDAIRETAVTDKEAGGITQHIGASEAMINGQKIVFLDTPGHEAFTTLRARGAQVTDIAVLVVAADDGVMPQTIEAIDHAKAAGVPIIVAINKIDKPGCNPDQVKGELSEHGILVEDWGGDVISCEVSALKQINIDGLLEMILLQSEVLELKANPNRDATGTIIDAKVEKGRGIVTTLLVQNGTLEIGNSIVCGSSFGRVRALFNHVGKRVKKAGPSTGVEITGLNEVPHAGDRFFVVEDDKVARKIAEKKQIDARNEALNSTPQHVTLEDIFDRIQAGKTKEIKIVLKADVQGSLEALKTSLQNVSNEEVAVNIIHSSVGTVTESDVLLASASDAIIIGFNVRPMQAVNTIANREGVELKTYRIIYEAINDVKDALTGMLDPEYKEEVLGTIEVRQLIRVPNIGTIAGGYVLSGKITRSAEFRLIREGIVVHEGKIGSLKRFKDDVKEVAKGYECGIGFENYNDMQEGDIIEAFHMVEIKRQKN
jgi:translation initiation factor IF-2